MKTASFGTALVAFALAGGGATALVAPIPRMQPRTSTLQPFTSRAVVLPSRTMPPAVRLRGGASMVLPALPTLGLTAASLNLKTLFAASLVGSSIGFKSFVYFFSLGYGATMALLGYLALALGTNKSTLALLHAGGFLAYGVRLGVFLLLRERIPSQKKRITDREESATLSAKASIWMFCGLLYPMMFCPAYCASIATPSANLLPLVKAGLGVMWGGLALESIADWQKMAAKAKSPDAFVQNGVWALSRHANYLGEILFYLGNFIAGIAVFHKPVHWVLAVVGTAGIINTMLSATKRLEERQQKQYGNDAAYKDYCDKTPSLLFAYS